MKNIINILPVELRHFITNCFIKGALFVPITQFSRQEMFTYTYTTYN